MRVRGLDFTSSSNSGKANYVVEGSLSDHVLTLDSVRRLGNRSNLTSLLSEGGSWVLGLDLPFGLPSEFVEAQHWGQEWVTYAARASSLSYDDFRECIERFRDSREEGRKQPRRCVDRLARSQSPLTTVRTPVARMFHAGVRWLLDAPCDVLPFRSAGRPTVVVEAYPALIARRLVAGNRYKDGDSAQTREVRDTLLRRITRGDLSTPYGFHVCLSHTLEQLCLADDAGDVLDSVLCVIQAAWAHTQRDRSWGIPEGVNKEGWITDPTLVRPSLGGSPTWKPIREDDPLPAPPRSAFNSSHTRVRPVIRALLRTDRTGRTWLPSLLKLATRNAETATRYASTVTSLDPKSLTAHNVPGRDGMTESVEGCFERSLPPSASLLRWCIDSPHSLARPKKVLEGLSRNGRRFRGELLGQDDAGRRTAQAVALAFLKQNGPEGSRRAWWAFEGFTSVDCALETAELLLLIEGKRFESVSSGGSWIPERNQISRNLEVASEYARQVNKSFAVLLIGPDGTEPPTDATLRAGWPHLTQDAQDTLLRHFLGATTWRSVCDACGLDYEILPITTEDATSSAVP